MEKILYNGQFVDEIQAERLKIREKKGFSVGKCGAMGYTKEEYNKIIVSLQNENPQSRELIAAIFPYAF